VLNSSLSTDVPLRRSGGSFTFSDTPGVAITSPRYGTLWATSDTFYATASVSVSDGSNSVPCGSVSWSATVNVLLLSGYWSLNGQSEVTSVSP
jgi:hypothetical protein